MLEQTFSWQALKWRLRAWRTGKSFAEIAMHRSLVYRVEQLFLIHRETDRWLLHVAADPALIEDDNELATMLHAIEDFARDAFGAGNESHVEEFRMGEMRVWIAPGRHAYLAAVIRGNPPSELRAALEKTIESIHRVYGSALAHFDGDPSPFEAASPDLTACLRAEYKTPRRAPHRTLALGISAAVAAIAILLPVAALRGHQHWRDFLTRLQLEPGILVATTERHWFAPSRVVGLRDPLARDPATIAKEAGLTPARIHFEWKNYMAEHPAIVQRRFVQRFGSVKDAQIVVDGATVQISGRVPHEWLERVRREATSVPGVTSLVERDVTVAFDAGLALERFKAAFPPPRTVRLVVANSTLTLAGTAPYEWVASVREGAIKIPGISAINGDDLVVEFDPKLVLQRFQDQFGIPNSINASVQNGRLILSGEAPHPWLDQVRRGAMQVPGVRVLDDRKVQDLDQRIFYDAKSAIESAYVSFILNRTSFAPDGAAALARVAEEIRRCFTAAQNMGVNVNLEVRGYGDAIGEEAANNDLSRRRAEAVRTSLVSGGIDGDKIKSLGLGAPIAPAPGEKAGAGQFDRRVVFRVVIQP